MQKTSGLRYLIGIIIATVFSVMMNSYVVDNYFISFLFFYLFLLREREANKEKKKGGISMICLKFGRDVEGKGPFII